MSYPQPIFQDIAIYLEKHLDQKTQQLVIDQVNVQFPHDHEFVVAMNKWITLAMVFNTTVYYLPSRLEGGTRALYTTKYLIKKPLLTYECMCWSRL